MRRMPPVKETKRASFWAMFFSPLATLDSLREHPRWLWPILVSAVLSAAVNHYMIQSIGFVPMIEAVSRSKGILDTQGMLENALAHKNQILLVQAATSFLSPLLIALIIATILWLLLTILGHEISWKKNLAIVAHANMLALALKQLMTVLTVSIIPDIQRFDLTNPLATNIAFFIKPASPALFRLLLSFDVLTFLNMALLILGLAKICPQLSKKAAAMIVCIPWALYVGGRLMAPLLFA